MPRPDDVHSLFLPPPEGLPLYWVGMGEETRRSPSYRWHGLQRGPDEIVLWQRTLSGYGWMEIAGSPARRLDPGQGFLVRIPSDHCYFRRRGDEPWHFVWMMWAGPALRSVLDALSKTDVRLTETGSPELVRSLLLSRSNGLPSTPDESVEAYRLLIDLFRPKAVSRMQTAPVLPRLEAAARRQPSAQVGKEGLAAALRLSRFQLYRAVRKETGRGPKDWTARRRLNQACRLLRETSRPVSEIATEVGLPDANYFARFFRKRTGFSPRDWRRLFAASP